jgi:hypothetical protein
MAAMAAGCSSDEECFDFTINLNYDKAKNVVSDVVASGTWQYVDATGAGGFVGGGCEADAGAKGDPKVSLSVTKNTPNGLKEIKTMLRWSSQARCAASLEAPPPVPSSQKMFYFGTRCEVMVYEWSSSKPGQYCNNRYTGRTYAEINYDQNKPPNAMQADKDQVRGAQHVDPHATLMQINSTACWGFAEWLLA